MNVCPDKTKRENFIVIPEKRKTIKTSLFTINWYKVSKFTIQTTSKDDGIPKVYIFLLVLVVFFAGYTKSNVRLSCDH